MGDEKGKGENKYFTELKKFEGKEVCVTDVDGATFEGVCLAINYAHMNVILKTHDDVVIIVRNVANTSYAKK